MLTINANAPGNSTETSYAAVTNMTNGDYVWVGPWSYTGSGTSYSVTLSGGDLDVTTATNTSLKVLLYNNTINGQVLDSVIPSGSPLTLEAPEEYFGYYTYQGYYNNTTMSCATTVEDGNCTDFNFQSYLTVPGSSPVTSEIEIIDLSNSATVFLGPVTISGGSSAYPTFALSASQFNLAAGQQAVSQVLEAQLIDLNSLAVLDQKTLGTFNLEHPSDYIASSSINPIGTSPYQSFVLTINANAPGNSTETSYASVTNMTNGDYVWVGPWSYTGSATSYSVTLSGGDLGVTTATNSSLKVLLYNNIVNGQVLDNSTPSGLPLTLEGRRNISAITITIIFTTMSP